MSDDFNFFDDDSLIPDWLRDDSAADDEPVPAAPPPPAGSAPWDRFRGDAPPPPSGRTPAPPPWETFRGSAAPPPSRSSATPPWGESAMDFADQMTEPADLDDALDWSQPSEPVPGAAANELPRGMTEMLPWREEAQPPSSPIRRIGSSGEPPAAHPAQDNEWLDTFGFGEAASLENNTPSGEVDDLDWLSASEPTAEDDLGTFTFADSTPPAAESGMDDLEALFADEFAEPETPPAAEDDLSALFADEFPEPEAPPAAPYAEPSAFDDLKALFADEFPEAETELAVTQEDEDFAWLDDDLGDMQETAAEEPESEWLQARYADDEQQQEQEEPESAAEEPPAPPSPIRRITPAAAEQPPAPPSPIRGIMPADEQPPAPPSSPIRRIMPTAEQPPAEPEPEEEVDMATWLARMGNVEEDTGFAAEPAEMTYEEWEDQQADQEREARKTEEDRMFEQGPDWFSETAAPPSASTARPAAPPQETGPEFVPEWFLGLEEQKEEAAPDWFKKLDLSADALTAPVSAAVPSEPPPDETAAPSAPDWFTGAALPGFDESEWQAAFGAPPSSAPEPSAPEPVRESPPPGPIRRIAPAAEEPPAPPPEPTPDWLSDSMWETPPTFAEEAPMSSDDFELPDFEAGEEDEIAPGDVPGWLSEAAPEPAAEQPLEDEFALPDFDLDMGAEGEIAPGDVPGWLSEAAPEPFAEQPLEDEFALPDFDLDMGAEGEIAPGEVPDWLTAEQDARAAPGDVPFPEIDLDQTMPTERAFDAVLQDTAEDELGGLEDWMTDFVPAEGGSGRLRRLPHEEEEAPDDFVERFDPIEAPSPAPAPVDEEAPDWLRDMADEGLLGDMSLTGETQTFPADQAAGLLPGEEALDWLSDISAEDVQAEPETEWAYEEMPPKPDETIPDLPPGTLHTAPLDSSAIDHLLGLYESKPEAAPEAEELAWDFEPPSFDEEIEAAEESAEAPEQEQEQAGAFEISGVPDWEWMQAEAGEQAPDLGALFDDAALDQVGGLFPPGGEAQPEFQAAAEPLPAVPEAQPRFGRRKPEPEPAEPEAPSAGGAQPEWIAEMRPSDLPVVVKAGGAETSITQKQVLELPDRLRAFRDAAMREVNDLYEKRAATPAASAGPLAGIAGALPVADLILDAGGRPVEGLIVTPEQQARLNRLQALLETAAAEEEGLEEEKAHIAGVESFELEGFQTAEQPAPEAAPKRARRRRRFKPDRVFAALLLLAALIVPFATDALHIASDPPALEGQQLVVGSVVDTLTEGQYVLFAFEYGPTTAGELDPLAEAVLRDVLAQGAIPLTISTDPAGAFHAQAVIEPLVEDTALLTARGQSETALAAGEDYVLLRFLAGEAVGVRSLRSTHTDDSGNLKQLFAFKTDLRGDETNLLIGSLAQNIALIVVVGAESDAVRTWAEQLNDVPVPKVALVTAAAEPLTVPYLGPDGYAGYLAGVRDTYSYNAARNAANRTPYIMPDDVAVDVPNPEVSRWHSMALGAAAAAALIALGMVLNLFRGLTRRLR